MLDPFVAPKFAPEIVTIRPTSPMVGERLAIIGVGRTVNDQVLLSRSHTVTMTSPLAAPLGTGTVMRVALQLVGTAWMPLNVTVPLPCVG